MQFRNFELGNSEIEDAIKTLKVSKIFKVFEFVMHFEIVNATLN